LILGPDGQVQQHGNQSQTARDLGLQLSVLRGRIKEFNQDGEKAFPGKGHTKEEELRQLQPENQRLKETVEILWRQWVSWSSKRLDLISSG